MRHAAPDSHRDSGFQCISLRKTEHSWGESGIPNTEYQPGTPCRAKSVPTFSAARFLGCLPALQPVQLAIRVAKPPPVPSPRAWPLTSAPAIAARLAPTETPQARRENRPNIHRRAPPEYFSNTARRPPENPREYFANTSRIHPGHLPGHFGFVCDSFSGELFEKYSGGFRTTIRANFRVGFRMCVFGRSSGGIREVFGGARAVFGKGSVGIRAAFLPRMRGLGGGQAGGHSLPVPAKALFDHSAACATPWRDARGQRWDFGTAAPRKIFATYALQAFPTLVFPLACLCLPVCVSCLSFRLWFPLSFLLGSLCLVVVIPFAFPVCLPCCGSLCLSFGVPCVLSLSSLLRFLFVFPFVVPFVFPSVFPLSCLCLPFCVSESKGRSCSARFLLEVVDCCCRLLLGLHGLLACQAHQY